MSRIVETSCDFEREPLRAPFGFKGGYVGEIWQSISWMRSAAGAEAVGLASQSVLWSDSSVFRAHSEAGGNSLMLLTTEYALEKARQVEWGTPLELLDQLLPDVYDYARTITNAPDLRLTFALNALVGVDIAAWTIFCSENSIASFDEMLPVKYRPALSHRQSELACIPLMTYGVSTADVVDAVKSGWFFLKIKIGADPDGDGDQRKMLEWDKQRIREIHEAVKHVEVPQCDSGRVPYYLDANGRYESKETLMELLEEADRIGAMEHIILLEEPFPESYRKDISEIPVRLAADESAHSDREAAERIDMGYRAIALKPIAKTLSMSLRIAELAHEREIPCFCADLTVNPILVDWNKSVAARLQRLPGVKIGLCESNGPQNYRNWEEMKSHLPCPEASWVDADRGIFKLNKEFYDRSACVLTSSDHYKSAGRAPN